MGELRDRIARNLRGLMGRLREPRLSRIPPVCL